MLPARILKWILDMEINLMILAFQRWRKILGLAIYWHTGCLKKGGKSFESARGLGYLSYKSFNL